MATSVNPYQAPGAAVRDAGDQVQEVKVFSTEGRIGRARYIAYGIGFYILFGALAGGMMALGTFGAILAVVAWVALLVIGFMLTIQRCHDFNTTGWLSLLMLIPLANLIFVIIPGTDGPNNYGGPTPPNGIGVLIVAWFLPVIMIVGILAAIALPAYQDYTKRAQQKQQQQLQKK
jgi:uncharacterized membrane protein YhaH (DUF805 family)